MGYNIEFRGQFGLNKELDENTFEFLKKLSTTRRMKRNVHHLYGVEGEFYVNGSNGLSEDVVDGNCPPSTQPSLWCQWRPTKDKMGIEWDKEEKFSEYIPWIKYIISKVLAPRGYVLNGVVDYEGEEFGDHGEINIVNNVVDGERLIVDYSINKCIPLPEKTYPKENAQDAQLKVLKDIMLDEIRLNSRFNGSLEEFKLMLKSLLQ